MTTQTPPLPGSARPVLRSQANETGERRDRRILHLINRFRLLRSPEVAVMLRAKTTADFNQFSRSCRRLLADKQLGSVRLPGGLGDAFFLKVKGKARLMAAGVTADEIRAYRSLELPAGRPQFHDVFAIHCLAWAIQWSRGLLPSGLDGPLLGYETEPELRRRAGHGEHVADFRLRWRLKNTAATDLVSVVAEVEWAEKDGGYARIQAEALARAAKLGHQALVFVPRTPGVGYEALVDRQVRYLNDFLDLVPWREHAEPNLWIVYGDMKTRQSMRPTFKAVPFVEALAALQSSGKPVTARRRRDAMTARFKVTAPGSEGEVRVERIGAVYPVCCECGPMPDAPNETLYVNLLNRISDTVLFGETMPLTQGMHAALALARRWLLDDVTIAEHLERSGFNPATGLPDDFV
ncbi:MAG: hypothetical protein KBC73_04750 [Burkholderiaceae bacterium]|nr:hypothetical protein [Burkholderiaceae bacterium]